MTTQKTPPPAGSTPARSAETAAGVATWNAFCDSLRKAGEQILRPGAPRDALTQAEGYRYLTRLLRIGLNMQLEFADADFPGFFSPSDDHSKIGADNPDNLYLMARINGRNGYVIRGLRGTVSYLSLSSRKGGYEKDGQMEESGFLDAADLETDADGHFEIVVSATPQPRNWLKTDADTTTIVVRQTFLDRANETPAQMTIARRGNHERPQPLTLERLRSGLENAMRFVDGTVDAFAGWAESYAPHVNQLPPADQAVCQRIGGDPNIFYYHSTWALGPDEALVFHIDHIPDCRFWNLVAQNWWLESLDYRFHHIHVNQHSAVKDADGGVTVILAHRDPGRPNWLETAGHLNGSLCMRWVGATEHVHPTTRVVRFSEIAKGSAA